MRRTLTTGLFVAGLAVSLGATGCSSATGDTGGGGAGGGGAGGDGGGATTTATTTTTTTVASTSTGITGDGNDSFETAEETALNETPTGDLDAPGDSDYFKFTGTKGQALLIAIEAQEAGSAFDPDVIDTVITLFDENKQQIAENNDPVPTRDNDSELLTILPADGTYYIQVTECWTWATSPASACGGTDEKGTTSYALGIYELDSSMASNVADAETGDDAASATPITYSPAGTGYYLSVIWGDYESNTDIDVYSIKFPADMFDGLAADTRPTVNNWMFRDGKDGSGSTTLVGNVYLTTAEDPLTKVALVSGADFAMGKAPQLSPPIDESKEYLLFFEHPGTPAEANDFYFAFHGGGGSNPLELSDLTNDLPATAEVLTGADNGAAFSAFIEGDLDMSKIGGDLDHYSLDVSGQAGKKARVACAAWRVGSGLRGLKAELVKADGTSIAGSSDTETGSSDVLTTAVALPPGEAAIVLKLSAASQSPDVTSSFYRCGVHLQ